MNATYLDNNCNISNKYALSKIEEIKPDYFFIAQSEEHQKTDWIKISKYLKKIGGKKIVLIGPSPQWTPSLPFIIGQKYINEYEDSINFNKNLFISKDTLTSKVIRIEKHLKNDYSGTQGILYISLIDEVCNDSVCKVFVPGSQELLLYDYGHLTSSGSILAAELINKKLN